MISDRLSLDTRLFLYLIKKFPRKEKCSTDISCTTCIRNMKKIWFTGVVTSVEVLCIHVCVCVVCELSAISMIASAYAEMLQKLNTIRFILFR